MPSVLMHEKMVYLQPFVRSPQADDIVVLGSGRSGTTWLLEMLISLPGYRGVMEPFQPKNASHFPQNPRYSRRYLREGACEPELEAYFQRLFHQELDSDWWCAWPAFNRRPRRYQTVLKTIRGLLMINWMKTLPVRFIYLQREPVATLGSWVRIGWGESVTDLAVFVNQPELVEDHLQPVHHLLGRVQAEGSKFEQAAACWWIENLVAQRTLPPGSLRLSYQELTDNRPESLDLICGFMGQERPEFLVSSSQRRSKTTVGVTRPNPELERAVRRTLDSLEELAPRTGRVRNG